VLQLHRRPLIAFDRAICDKLSESLAMLFRACFTKQAIDQGILPNEYVFGDVLMIETVRLKTAIL
jgi:hypothetical protein